MSSGAFIRSRYAASYGDGSQIHPIKIQPETTGLQFGTDVNTPPTGAATSPISAVVTNGRRSLGLTPRKVTIKFTGTTPVNGAYEAGSTITLPWLTPFPATFIGGLAGTYLGDPIELVSTSAENVR